MYRREALDVRPRPPQPAARGRGCAPAAHRRALQDLAVRARRRVTSKAATRCGSRGPRSTASGLLALLSIGGAVVDAAPPGTCPPLYPLLAPIVVVFVTVVVTYASTRFRTTAEPSFVVLAAVAIDAGIRAGRPRRRAVAAGDDLRVGEELIGVAGHDGHDRALRIHARCLRAAATRRSPAGCRSPRPGRSCRRRCARRFSPMRTVEVRCTVIRFARLRVERVPPLHEVVGARERRRRRSPTGTARSRPPRAAPRRDARARVRAGSCRLR